MTVDLRRSWHRLRQMSWDEMRTRVSQEVHKRLDLIRYKQGSRPLPPPRLDAGKAGKFFFSPAQIPALIALIRERLPFEVVAIIREADEICRHEFRLLGYTGLSYGPQIDWHLDRVSGMRAPLKPWFKIPFLDYRQVGDHKVIWELNRHQHLVTLAKAWRLTARTHYLDEIVRQWKSWQLANPYPAGINWASSLEVAFRSLSWIWVHQVLGADAALPAAWEEDILAGLALNGRYIERYLSTYFSPNTHLLGEALGLFVIGVLYPQIKDAERWRRKGWQTILEESQRQVRADGVYFEQSFYYHVYALDMFLHAKILAEKNQMPIPGEFDDTLTRMLDVVGALSQAGTPDGFGDDDGGRVFNPRRNRAEHLRDPLALGAVLYGRDAWDGAATLTEEALWLLGEQAARHFDRAPRPVPSESRAFSAGGLFIMAGSEPVATQLEIDAGPQGTGRSGHGHADALSVRLSAGGRRWLTDRGTFVYLSGSGEERNLFRGTAAHNTLMVDGLDQAVPQGPFAWASIPSVQAELWIPGKSFDLFVGTHDGYSRLPDPVIHRRFVFHLKHGLWLVRDLAEGKQLHDLAICWHFASGVEVSMSDGCVLAGPREKHAGSIRLALLPAQGAPWVGQIRPDDTSPAYGTKERANLFRYGTRLQLPAESATLVLALAETGGRAGQFTEVMDAKEAREHKPRAYRYDETDRVHWMVFADHPGSWELGPWTSDARFFYCCLEQGQLRHLILCQGGYATVDGRSIVSYPVPIERWELVEQQGNRQVFSSAETPLASEGDAAVDLAMFEG